MQCPIYSGELAQKEAGYKFDSSEVNFQFFKCNKCNEELVFEAYAQKVFDRLAEYKSQRLFRKRLGYAGNSLVLRIPVKLANALGLHKGSEVQISAKKSGFAVSVKE